MSQLPIFTVGYGTREIDQFIAVLKENEIAFLLDVRSKPYSRYKPDFSKKELTQHLTAHGIRYVFMGDTLGGMPEDPACYTNGKIDYEKVAKMDFYQKGIGRLQTAYQQQQRVAIMCSEGKPEKCHRAKLIAKTLVAAQIDVRHIDENNQLITQQAAMLRLHNGQPSFFDTPPPPPPVDDWYPPDDFDDPQMPDWQPTEEPGDWYFDEPFADEFEPVVEEIVAAPVAPFTPDMTAVSTTLNQTFGYNEFRPLQEEVIEQILHKKDTLAIMPTGSGKSICFQIPALLFPGMTVVVSPLISLMEDQVMQLKELGITAVYLNSTLSLPDYQRTVAQIRAGKVDLLYAAPETLVRPAILSLLAQCPIDCFTIDEAHCISEWGHDFRPEYRQLTDVRRRLPHAVCLAVTATATDRVRHDIKTTLGIADADEFIASFDRENLYLSVAPKTSGLAQAHQFLAEHRGESGIIYCAKRSQVDNLTQNLAANGWPVLPYHAGLDDQVRRQNQRRFSYEEGIVIVATIAFGMGINKSNVRFILHHDLPKNVESYYQQIGRAGRDGLRADCLLLFSYGDVGTITYFIQQQAQKQQIGARARLEAMLGFVEADGCRRRPLLNYFGEEYTETNCELCDNCTASEAELTDVTEPAQKFLSCVYRTRQIFGMNHIIDVLRGSQSKKVVGKGHNRLTTYNIGTEFSKKEWQYLARQFIQKGLLTQDMDHGSLQLTDNGWAVLKDGEKVLGTLPERETAVSPSITPAPTDHDRTLFDLLRRKRTELATAANVPPYVIFSDRSLVDMAAFFPQTRASFSQMYGVGAAKLEKYADEFLPIIETYCIEHGIAEKPKAGVSKPITPRLKTGLGNRTEEVIFLYNEGHSVPDIMQQYNVKQSTVINHLWKGVVAERELRPSNLLQLTNLTNEQHQQAFAAFTEHGTDRLRPIFDALNETVNFDELHVLRLHFILKTSN
ncbi:MAG: DNA helicase RecQ [Chloroflexi bacterium]|nr:MAG: DNA helicase RecQ [Chloroflexota bacterium]